MPHDPVIENEVRSMLEASPAFHALSLDERRGILDNTTKVASKLVEQQLARTPQAGALADPTGYPGGPGGYPGAPGGYPGAPGGYPGAPTNQVPEKWTPDERFQAEATGAGVTQMARLVREVNFPAFVSSLVKGVFNAVVDASIQQMKAYGELVNSVAMSLSDFVDQHTDVAEGQKHLAKKYPNIFEITSGKLKVKEDYDSDSMPDFQAELGTDAPIEDLEEADALQKLVVAARTEIARGRQQLLATTILMGINRIIVTDGKINAKVSFNFTASDTVERQGQNMEYEKQVMEGEITTTDMHVKGRFEQPVGLKVFTQGDSTGAIEANAALSGDVTLRFKSETFPLEKMMNSTQLFALNQAQSGGRGTPAGAPPPAAAAPPAPAPVAPQQPAAPLPPR
jgi:hypothetical protein